MSLAALGHIARVATSQIIVNSLTADVGLLHGVARAVFAHAVAASLVMVVTNRFKPSPELAATLWMGVVALAVIGALTVGVLRRRESDSVAASVAVE